MYLIVLTAILFCQSSTATLIDARPNEFCTTCLKKVTKITSVTDYINSVHSNISQDGLLDFEGLSKKYLPTHSIKEYDVVTEDGYILKIFRILSKSKCSKVALMSHGVIATSDDFILRGNTSLIYMLAQKDFDIWAINYRGNRYSRRHQVLNPDIDQAFWEYSVQELGYYDLAAVIDFILKKTDKTSLSFVGHSEGSATVFVLTSLRPEYNDKIKVVVAMAPACYITHSGIGMRSLIELFSVIGGLLKVVGINEILGFNSVSTKLLQFICSEGEAGYITCVDGIFALLSGREFGNIELEFTNIIFGHAPAGTSRKNLVHYSQIGTSGRFAQFDLGLLNRVTYGRDLPPEYDLQKVTTKVALVAAKNDQIIGLKDVEKLRDQLPNVISYYEVNYNTFTHLDCSWGRNAHEVLYPHVIDVLNNHL